MRRAASAPLTEADILAALRDCYFPGLHANVVDLGLIHSVAIAPDATAPGTGISGVPPRFRVRVALMSSSRESSADEIADAAPDELTTQIAAQIENRLAAFPSVSRTEVHHVRDPAWSPDRIAPQLRARVMLAIASNQRPDALVQIQTNPARSGKNS